MQKILLVQSRSKTEMIAAERKGYRVALEGLAKLEYLSALDEKLSSEDPKTLVSKYDGIIFGGSSDYDFDGGRMKDDPFRLLSMIILSRTKNLINFALDQKIPVLGVCFGHQMIANMHGGEVMNDHTQKKRGTFEVELTAEGAEDPLFGKLPHTFMAQYGHKDSVTKLPKGAKIIAKSAYCRYAALRYGDHIYTTQFHPELTAAREKKNLETFAGYLPEGSPDEKAVVVESPEASKIIPLWIGKVVGESGSA